MGLHYLIIPKYIKNTFLQNIAYSISDDEISGTYKLNQEYNNYVYNSIYSSINLTI